MLPRHPRPQGCISSTSGLLLATHGSLLGTHDSLLGTHESRLSIHESLLGTHESLLDYHGITDLATHLTLAINIDHSCQIGRLATTKAKTHSEDTAR